MSEHIVPVRIYVTIFLVLLVGTALTVWAAFQDFPWQLNTIVAMAIVWWPKYARLARSLVLVQGPVAPEESV